MPPHRATRTWRKTTENKRRSKLLAGRRTIAALSHIGRVVLLLATDEIFKGDALHARVFFSEQAGHWIRDDIQHHGPVGGEGHFEGRGNVGRLFDATTNGAIGLADEVIVAMAQITVHMAAEGFDLAMAFGAPAGVVRNQADETKPSHHGTVELTAIETERAVAGDQNRRAGGLT